MQMVEHARLRERAGSVAQFMAGQCMVLSRRGRGQP
jgi:hypothetical protein